MLRNVFLKTLRDRRHALIGWGLGLLAVALFVLLFYPAAREMEGIMEAIPPELAKLFMGEVADITSPEGFLNSQLFFLMAPVMFLVIAIAFGSGAIAGEEEQGTLDLLLSNPLPRWRLVAEKFAALVVYIGMLALVFWLTLALGVPIVDMDISLGRMAEATLSMTLLGIAFGTLALAVGCASGRRGLSTAVASAIGVAGYLINSLSPIAEALEPFQKLSPFYYYIGANPLLHGLNLGHAATLVGLIVVLLLIALVTFERRDLAT